MSEKRVLEFANPYIALEPYVGELLKYGQICNILDQKKQKGSSRQKQVERWAVWCDISRWSNRYRIKRLYTIEDKIVFRKEQQKWKWYIRQHIINCIAQAEKERNKFTIQFTLGRIVSDIFFTKRFSKDSMYNNVEYWYSSAEKELKYNNNVSNKIRYDSKTLFNITFSLFKKIVVNAIDNQLNNNEAITVEKCYWLSAKQKNDGIERTGRFSTKDETLVIQECEKRALFKYNLENNKNFTEPRFLALNNPEYKKYKELLDEIIAEEFNDEYNHVSQARTISVDKDHVQDLCEINLDKSPLYALAKKRFYNKEMRRKFSESMLDDFYKAYFKK